MSEMEIASTRKETGLIGGVEKRAIEIVDYNPVWPEKYSEHAELIRTALGSVAVRIEHIGSTSVPGLAAKPIIDILVVVPNSPNESEYLPKMVEAGYELRVREPEFFEHRMFRTVERDVHIHFFSPQSPEIERYITFRDRLRTSDEDRGRYEETKRKLAQQEWADMDAYANAKTAIIADIISNARNVSGVTS